MLVIITGSGEGWVLVIITQSGTEWLLVNITRSGEGLGVGDYHTVR